MTAHVLVDIGDADVGGPLIMSSITNESVDGLGLKSGDSVYVVVKASDVNDRGGLIHRMRGRFSWWPHSRMSPLGRFR